MENFDPARSPYSFPIKRPVLATLIVITVAVFGILSLGLLPVNMMPEISYPSITVRTEYAGAAPEEVEQVVTYPLEQSLGVLRNLVEIKSSSRAGFSDIQLEFGWNTDMNRATQEVREKLDLVFLPEEVDQPLILRYDPTLDPLLRIGLTSDSLAPRELRELAERIVKTELEKLNGVAAVKVKGGEEAEIRVEVNAAALDLLDLTLSRIESRIRSENVNVAGGRLQDGQAEYLLRTIAEFKSIKEIEDIAIDLRGDQIIRLRDVATVSLASKEITNLTRSGGKPSVELELFRESDANPVKVSDAVLRRINGKEVKKPPLPSQMKGIRREAEPLRVTLTDRIPIEILSDQAEFLRQAIAEVKSAAIWGGLLAILVLYLFLGNLLDTLIVAMVIPVSMVSAFAAMNYWHVTLNVMSLGGLALGVGMMVDNSIVVVESIFRRREQGDAPELAAVKGTHIVGGAVIASTTTTIVVFFPVVFVTGVAGQIFNDLSMTVIIAIFASLMIALFYVPMLVVKLRWREQASSISSDLPESTYWLGNSIGNFHAGYAWFKNLSKTVRILLALFILPYLVLRIILESGIAIIAWLTHHLIELTVWLTSKFGLSSYSGIAKFSDSITGSFNRSLQKFTGRYTAFLGRHLERPLPILLTTLILSILIVVVLTPRLGSELIPEVSQGIFDVRVILPVGTSLEVTDRAVNTVEQRIQNHPEVSGISSRVGSDPTDANDIGEGTHTGRLTIKMKPGDNLQEREAGIVEEIRRIVTEIPSLKMVITHPTLFTFKQPIEIILKGDDLNQLKSTVSSVESALDKMSNLSDIESTVKVGNPEVIIEFDKDRLAHLNLQQRAIAEIVRSSVQGEVASKFRKVDRHVDIRVSLDDKDKSNVEDIGNLIINPDGKIPVRLSEVASLKVVAGPSEIRHTDGVRSASLSMGLAGLDLGRMTDEINLALAGIVIPPELSIELGGQFREMEDSLRSLYWALLLAIFLVYVAMASQFESFGHPFLILFTIPYAVVAVIPALWILNIPISIMVFLGLIILAGIVVDNSIVLIDYAVQLRRDGMSLNEALTTAASTRLRPILMTTLTTLLGLLPMALGVGEGSEMRRPMAVTVMVGLALGTVVTLVILPLIYRFVTKDRSPQ